ncbi:MAG: 4'-phosphopantetheinyl transferase superfamily protein [Lysobacteraceae bacterium]|nr:MAG: 4'-phosphopantetheinyl transferase superfamily protein [Xanthomonadaceae bacterium]
MTDVYRALADSLPITWHGRLDANVLVALAALDDWVAWVPRAHALLDDNERARVVRRRNPVHARELAFAYAMHRVVLAELLEVPLVQLRVERDAKGCPRLPGDRVRTSLSHADGVVAVAVAASGAVGIDIESRRRAGEMPEIAARVVHPREAPAILALAEGARGIALLDLWVRKEAVLKAAGSGLERDMDTLWLPADGVVPLDPAGPLTRVQALPVGDAWVAAVSAPPDLPVDWAWLRPAG